MSSLFNLFTTANASAFQARIGMMLLRHAMYVRDLPDESPNKTPASLAIALKILGSGANEMPGGSNWSSRMAKFIASDVSLIDKVSNDVSGAEVTDADLASAIPTHFEKLA